jgi:cytochrome c peroxidase
MKGSWPLSTAAVTDLTGERSVASPRGARGDRGRASGSEPRPRRIVLLALAVAGAACLDNRALDSTCDTGCAFTGDEWTKLKSLTGLPPPSRDASNAVDGNQAAIALGKAFFSDARFSGTATQVDALKRPAAVARAPLGQPANLSCASCHDLGRAGVDTTSVPDNVSAGAGWTDVNALGVVNAAYQRLFSWNGRADSLWAQAFAVAESPTTMNGDRLNTAWVIYQDYYAQYYSVFGASPPIALDPTIPAHGKPGAKPGCQSGDPTEPFGDAWDCLPSDTQDRLTRVLVNWAKAIAAYEATLTSRHSSFDVFMAEGPQSTAISAAAKRGASLFVGKASCIDCHNTPLLSDGDFHDVGVPQAGPAVPTEADCPAGGVCDCVAGKNCLPWGALDGLAKLQVSKVLRSSIYSDDPKDGSRADELARAGDPALKGAWRTPSLRNVALTYPYMHDGVYATLEDVVAHYDRGGDPTAVGTRAVDIRPIGLTTDEQADLVAFLESLTETSDVGVGPTTGTGGAGGGSAGMAGGGSGGVGPVTGGGGGFAGSSVSGGSGGIGGIGGIGGRGGIGATGGMATGAAGSGAPPPPVCLGTPPPTPLITNSPLPVVGAPYTFSASGLTPPAVASLMSPSNGSIQALQVTASPGIAPDLLTNYLGFGLPFVMPPCLDARMFSGVQFTVSGDLGTCQLLFGAVSSEDNSVMYSPFGACPTTGSCISPLSPPLGLGTTIVRFADLSGGKPLDGVDPMALNDVQWLLIAPTDPTVGPCTVNITVSDVMFVP